MLTPNQLIGDQIDILKVSSRTVRQILGLTQKDLGNVLEYDNTYISMAENEALRGKKHNLRSSMWLAYYLWLLVSYSTLEEWQQVALKTIFGPDIESWNPSTNTTKAVKVIEYKKAKVDAR